jgi:osmotically-inducible protein OsmY
VALAQAGETTDREIQDRIQNTFNFRTVLGGAVTVRVANGLATLSGNVPDSDAKSLAVATAECSPGVVRINNDIVAKWSPPLYSDAWVETKVRDLLLVRANVSAATTKITAREGEVTLDGTVGSEEQRRLTERYAREIDRVRSVRNRLVVVASGVPPDTLEIDDVSISAQVRYALLLGGLNNRLQMKIESRQGAVDITGVAGDQDQLERVTTLARTVRGVRSVSNRMQVKS